MARDKAPSNDIIIVATDEYSAEYFAKHPELGIDGRILPRKWLARVVDYLNQQHAKSIVLDVELKARTNPKDDKALNDSIAKAGNVFVTAFYDVPFPEFVAQVKAQEGNEHLDFSTPAKQDELKYACSNLLYTQRFQESLPGFLYALQHHALPANSVVLDNDLVFCRITPVLPQFLLASRGLGISTVEYDNEGVLRKIPVVMMGYKQLPYAYMGLRVAMDAMGNPELSIEPGKLTLQNKASKKELLLVDGKSLMINWRNPARLAPHLISTASTVMDSETLAHYKEHDIHTLGWDHTNLALGHGYLYRYVSVADILKIIENPDIAPSEVPSLNRLYNKSESGTLSFDNTIVIYGDTVKDIHRTPVGNIISGPEIIGATIDSLIHDTHFVHPSPTWLNWLAVLIMTGVMLYGILKLKRLHIGFLSGLLVLSVFWMYNFILFATEALWLPLVWPTLIGVGVLSSTTLYRYYVQDREKRELTTVFSKYVSPQIMTRILSNPARAMQNLQGAKKELTVLFTDIHNFTSQFENAEPEQIVVYLNEYFNIMTQTVLSYEGTCDKYMGDSLMAFFGAPADLPDHAEKACRAALAMQKGLNALNEKLLSEGKEPIRHGIGISTGPMFVGNFGSDEIKNFSVLGSVVNLGARLETQTRASKMPIIISEATYQQVKHWAKVKDLGEVSVKGFSHPVRMYALESD